MPKREEHYGTITDNNDPEKRGRVSVQCPTITSDVIEWVEPEFHFVDSAKDAGAFFVPANGSQVTVSIEAEEDSEVMGLEPRWRCTIYPIGKLPEIFETNYPERRGWVTGAGHQLYMDDTSGEHTFTYEHPTGATVHINNDGDIILTPAGGRSVKVGGSDATEALVLGYELKSYFNAAGSGLVSLLTSHTHDGGSPPAAAFPAFPTSALSPDNKVK